MSLVKIFLILTLVFVFFCLLWLAFIRHVNPAIPKSLPINPKEFLLKANEAQLSQKWSEEIELDVEDDGRFHIVTNVVLTTHRHYNVDLLYDDNRRPTEIELQRRQAEIEVALQKNLNSKYVAAVHVLYYHPAVHSYLMRLQMENSKKLVLHLTRRDPTVAINLDYIQKYLRHKFVLLMNQDNYLGEGWDDVDISALRTRRVAYALTRHAVTERFPCNAARSASCNPGAVYLGSHDTFAFYVDRKFSNNTLNDLEISPSSAGMENVLIWHLEKTLNYRVLNPCRKLIVYHNHCIPIRNSNRKRYNLRGKNGMVPFSEQLL